MIRRTLLRTAPLLSLLAAGLATGLQAQAAGAQVTGSAELGWRSFFDRPSALEDAKFEEYRDLSPGVFLQNLQLHVLPGDHQLTTYTLGAKDAFRRDQTFFGQASRPGLFDLRLGWDEIPHTYSTDGRNWGGSLTNFSLPTPRPDTSAWRVLSNSPYLDPIRNTWKVGRASLTLTPGEFSDLKLEYTRIAKSGARPMGMAFGSPDAIQREILEPINQTVNDVRVSQSYARRAYQFQFSYDLNSFSNADVSVSADNPQLATNSATAGAATGRTALAPSNLAQTLSFGGGASLPGRTRVNTALSYSWRSQNEPFIPMTDNAAITDPRQFVMPASLKGAVRTLMANLTATTRLRRDLTVTGRYRLFKYYDQTPEITAADMPVEIVNDRTLSVADTGEAVREAIPFERHNAGLDLGWRPSDLLNLKAGVAWERWDRFNAPLGPRNVRRNQQYTPRLTLDVTPVEWLLVRASVSSSRRRGTEYMEDMDREQLRRFDEADKNARRGDLMLQLTPNEQTSLDLTLGRGNENFPTGAFGVRHDDNSTFGADLGWTPVPRVNLFASYTREVYALLQRSRYGEPSLPDDTTYDWLANTREWVQGYGVGANATLVKNRLDVEFRYDRSDGKSSLHSMNPITPTGGTPSQNANATAVNFPDITHSWNPIRLAVRVQLNANWSGSLGYHYERFRNNDFRTNGLLPPYWNGRSPVDPAGDIILGNDLLSYRTNYLTFSIGFRPSLSRPVLSIM